MVQQVNGSRECESTMWNEYTFPMPTWASRSPSSPQSTWACAPGPARTGGAGQSTGCVDVVAEARFSAHSTGMQPQEVHSRSEGCEDDIGMRLHEEERFTAFVRDEGDGLLRFARRLIPDAGEAEDALQTALLRLTSHWPKEHPRAYVRASLVNLAKDRARRRHLHAMPTDVRIELPSIEVDHAAALDAQARLDVVLAALPTRQRVTVVLRVLEDMSEAETAQVLGCSAGAVKSNLARGLDKVRAVLSAPLTATEEKR